METFVAIIDTLVVVAGFLIWLLFIPQIRLLLRERQSRTNSIYLTGGSFLLQSLLLTQVVLYQNWPLAFVQTMSLTGVTVMLALILYYRRFPGGRA